MAGPVKFLLRALLLIAALSVRVVSAQPLTLDQVVSRAVNRANERETARVSGAIASGRYLDSQSKSNLERPRAGLLASGLGLGALLGGNHPSPWAMQNARLDTIAAEIAVERATMVAERDALERYFGLLQKQKATDAIGDLLEQQRARFRSADEKTKGAKATAIDLAVLETGVITLETQLEDVETQQQIATAALAELLGADESEQLLVADIELPERIEEVPSTAVFYSAALRKADSLAALRGKLEAEKTALRNIPSPKAENAALARAASARISTLESELADLHDSMRSNLDTLRLLVVSARHKAEQAARKLELAERIERLTSLRERSGLEGSQAVITAEMGASRARAESHEAESERNAAWTHLLVACDIRSADDIEKLLAPEGQPGKIEKSETEGLQ